MRTSALTIFWVSDFKVRRAAGDQNPYCWHFFDIRLKVRQRIWGSFCKMSLQLLEMNTCFIRNLRTTRERVTHLLAAPTTAANYQLTFMGMHAGKEEANTLQILSIFVDCAENTG